MTPLVVPGTANRPVAAAVCDALGAEPASCAIDQFPDGELRPVVDRVRGRDVYVVQPTAPPVSEHLVELLLLLDACRRGGSTRITAVVPYFGYARQDRRLLEGQAVAARVCVEALRSAGADRLVVVDPHTTALEAMCQMPAELLTAEPLLAAAVADGIDPGTVVVAPDLGAAKLAERYAAALGATVALVQKTRLGGGKVAVRDLAGEVSGRPSLIVDDMVSTGVTIEAAIGALRARGGGRGVTVVATHGVLVPGALERIARAGARRVVLTDTVRVPANTSADLAIEVCPAAPLLADAISRLHRDEPLDGLRLVI